MSNPASLLAESATALQCCIAVSVSNETSNRLKRNFSMVATRLRKREIKLRARPLRAVRHFMQRVFASASQRCAQQFQSGAANRALDQPALRALPIVE